ncbi:rRNA pseudouridine synthase [Ornithinibacillus gellani]|uniref:pseudouridine synthase n=1 Tax=Ornithinibacillus gellani TaxID=2293253 RepID=UPI000F46EF3E|nr:pseudouridine synthase [Ornithinibacillus gellani]TQS74448.1 rRNA pseudouridine synthase [Ornithinibacillus gellani]
MTLERLQKVIAQSGVTSRRKAEALILEGKVKVNHKVVQTLGTKVTPNDVIEVDGVELEKEAPVYYLFYKPRGVISSVSDDKGRSVVTDYLPEVKERIFPIGRLDYETSGILLMTNDGEFANLLMHPRHEVDKVYELTIDGIPRNKELRTILEGIKHQGDLLKATNYRVQSIDKKKNKMHLEITLNEGKNRHIRRMLDQLGYPVSRLKRLKYGLLTLDGLTLGQYRALTPKEVKQMRNLALSIVKH